MSRRVYKALDRPLRLCGVDRRLFFLALLVGAAAFNLFYSLLAGCLLFAVLYAGAWWATATDDRMVEILCASLAARPRYDAAQHDRVEIAVRGARW